MGYILQVMPESPQPHRIEQAAKLLADGQVAAVPTDSGFSLVCRLDDKGGDGQDSSYSSIGPKKALHVVVFLIKSNEQVGQSQQYGIPYG